MEETTADPGCREIWMVRHGQTAANVARIIQGQTDTVLTDEGLNQASALADWFARRGGPAFGALVSSPLSRTLQTAAPLAAALELSVREDAAWMERNFGVWEGRSAAEVYAEHTDTDTDAFDTKPDGGESGHEMADRIWGALSSWSANEDVGERLLVVTHGGPIGAVVCRCLGIPYGRDTIRRFRRDNTGVSVFRRRPHAPSGWVVDVLNARPHLS